MGGYYFIVRTTFTCMLALLGDVSNLQFSYFLPLDRMLLSIWILEFNILCPLTK